MQQVGRWSLMGGTKVMKASFTWEEWYCNQRCGLCLGFVMLHETIAFLPFLFFCLSDCTTRRHSQMTAPCLSWLPELYNTHMSFIDYHLWYSEIVAQNGLRQGNFERIFPPILWTSSRTLLHAKQLRLSPWSSTLLWPLCSTFCLLGHILIPLCKMCFSKTSFPCPITTWNLPWRFSTIWAYPALL